MKNSRKNVGGMVSGRIILALFAIHIAGGSALAAEPVQPLPPLIQSIFPRGGRAGSTFDITIRGKYLSGASLLRFSGTGVTAQIRDCSDSQIDARVTVAPGAAIGRRDLRVFTPQGTFVQVFEIGALPEQLEAEPNDDLSSARLVELPAVVNGTVRPGDYDFYRFRANRGQDLVFDLSSSRVGTRFDAVLALLDVHGRELAAQDDFYFDKDPHLAFRFSESGDYFLRVSGFREAGSNAAEYRLVMGELPNLSWVFPAGGRRGDQVNVTVAGVNLAGVDGLVLEGVPEASASTTGRTAEKLQARIRLPSNLEPGYYKLRTHSPQGVMQNPLIFAVSDTREMVLSGPLPSASLDLTTPVVVNGVIRKPKQADSFFVNVAAGEKISIQADGMSLGNFLDPTATIFDASGNVVAYMDESAPNGFDKDPPNLDFHLDHTFERAGRYRVEFRDAGLRGREDFVYRLLIGRSDPTFAVIALTNQATILTGHETKLPVRVKRLGGWNTPVKVWVEGLPPLVEAHSMNAEPVNTRFRGTFGEDFFFDGTNVDLPLQAQPGAPAGAYPVRILARGTMDGKTVERSAVVYYPWQQTGYIRGKADDQDFLLTVAGPPRFELEAPANVLITRGKPVEIPIHVRWFGKAGELSEVRIEPERLPAGLELDRFEVKPDGDRISVWLKSGAGLDTSAARISLAAVLGAGRQEYRRVTPDIELKPGAQPEGQQAGGR